VEPNKRIHTNPHTSAPNCYRDVLMRELGIRYGLGDPHVMPRSRCALSPRAVCHAACPPATRATTKSDGSLERFTFLSLGRSGSATKILVPRGAPRAPVKNGAKKRVKLRRARTRRDARKTTQIPRISSFVTARALTVDRSAQKWQELAGRALARVYPTSKKSPI
jgi:hypothetical protein